MRDVEWMVPPTTLWKMPVRVLWIVKGLGPGGAEHLLAAAAEHLVTLGMHIECAYILPQKDHLAARLEAAGVTTSCLSIVERDPLWPKRLTGLIRSGDWDVVHVHSPLPGSVARAAVRSLPAAVRPMLISTEHNRWQTHRRRTRMANRLTSRWDERTFAVSDEVRDSMRGTARTKAETLLHGIDVAGVRQASTDRAAVRAEFGFSDADVVLVTVANFRKQKDYPNLLRAVRSLHDRGVAFKLVAVGQGPDEAEVRRLAAELGVDHLVTFTGFRPDAVRVMAAADVFVLASQWEGLPVVLIEALALGLPVVATAVGGIAEIMRPDVDALLVPPSNGELLAGALARVISDIDLRTRLATAGAARAAEFDVARSADVVAASYVERTRPVVSAEVPKPKAPREKLPPLAIRPADDGDRGEVLALLRRSLGGDGDDPRFAELFAWKHDQNAFGQSPMWVATDEGRVAAFRALMRWEFERGGQTLRAVRAVDTATDPEYQGRGLFRSLTLHALEEMRADGVDFVFNTPNDQSRPGYLKMGWRQVGHLAASVHFSSPNGVLRAVRSKVAADRWSQDLDVGVPFSEWIAERTVVERQREPGHMRELRTRWTDESLLWRFGSPLLKYRVVDEDGTAVVVRSRTRGAALELAVVYGFGEPAAVDRLSSKVAKRAGADYAIRLGGPRASTAYAPLPQGGPILTWRSVNATGVPPLSNWKLSLGDIELF